MRTHLLSTVTLMAVLALGQAAAAQEEGAARGPAIQVTEAQKTRLARLLPEAAELAGAERSEATEFYSPTNLYEYIDGAAEGYLAYDFVALAHQMYKKGAAEITLDVFDMGTDENAYGVYASERNPQSRFLPIGSEGYSGGMVLNFLQGPYYVKLLAFDEPSGAALESFARAVAARIGGERTLPPALALFPERDLKPHTALYVKHAPLGHDLLGPAYLAKYQNGDQESTLLLSPSADAAQAAERLQRWRAFVERAQATQLIEKLGPGAFRGRTPYEGPLWAWAQGPWLVLLLNPPEPPDQLAEAVKAKLAGTK